jgi:ArsR family transcriptional regulator
MVTDLALLPAQACRGLGAIPLEAEQVESAAAMFRALGDPVRLRLAAMISARDEICVCELTPAFELSGPTISHHLRILREAGIVDSERRGTWVYYRIVPQAVHSLSALLAGAVEE